MISTDVSYLPGYAASGWLLPLDEALPQTERALFFKGTLDGVTYKGKLYSIPWFNNGPGLFYRKDLLDAAGLKAPATYDELVATSKRLQTPDVSGFVFQGSQNEGGIISWMELLWGHGGDILDEKLNVVVDQGSAATEALQRLVDFVYKDKISIEALLGLKTTTEVTSVFSEGHALFLRQWMSQTSFLDGDQSKVRGKWDVAPAPREGRDEVGAGVPRYMEPRRLGLLEEAVGGDRGGALAHRLRGAETAPTRQRQPADAIRRAR
jgi:multiple sugar transport system substrate-binding protein